MATTHWAIDGTLGADLENTITSATFAAQNDGRNRFRLGSHALGNNGSRWMFVYASAAITQYAMVGIRPSATITALDTTGARLGHQIGIAQTAFAAGDYGWVATGGRSLTVLTTGAAAVGVRLYCAASSAGRVTSSAASTNAQIGGLTLIATASGTSASNAACVAGYMQVVDAAFLV